MSFVQGTLMAVEIGCFSEALAVLLGQGLV